MSEKLTAHLQSPHPNPLPEAEGDKPRLRILNAGRALDINASGHWCNIKNAPDLGAFCADTIKQNIEFIDYSEHFLIPGIVNAHSHAFQRSIVGLTETGSKQGDDFWSWRTRMYEAALRITPADLEIIATQLYAELLRGGYTQVCEFHYLHNDLDGKPYADSKEMSLALVRAAQTAGIGLTLLPTLYQHSGFGSQPLRDEQRRFASMPEQVLRIANDIEAMQIPLVNVGVALHSLRAVDVGAMKEMDVEVKRKNWPIHIHISEQTAEVDACLALHKKRPLEFLVSQIDLDARWNLVHATHASEHELKTLAATKASIVLCPSTEANLGDGIFDAPTWLQCGGKDGGRWSIGSDSHVTRCASEELRLLEYSQRLIKRERNIWARHSLNNHGDTAQALLDGALTGGCQASGLPMNGIKIGQRADFCIYPKDETLATHIFSSPSPPPATIYVAGKQIN